MSKGLIRLWTGLNLFFLFTPSVNAADLFDIVINSSTKQIKSFAQPLLIFITLTGMNQMKMAIILKKLQLRLMMM